MQDKQTGRFPSEGINVKHRDSSVPPPRIDTQATVRVVSGVQVNVCFVVGCGGDASVAFPRSVFSVLSTKHGCPSLHSGGHNRKPVHIMYNRS